VEVKIGVQNANRELVLDSSESSAEVQKSVSAALTDGGVLSLTDAKGRTVLVPVEKLAYVEIGSPSVSQVGFRS
jgi:polysaccharide deacetylase 2 family uncharacterized protein YibQ